MLQFTKHIEVKTNNSKEYKQLTVNKKDSKLFKNRIAAKNERLQAVLCSQIDNTTNKQKSIEYRQQKQDFRRQQRQDKKR